MSADLKSHYAATRSIDSPTASVLLPHRLHISLRRSEHLLALHTIPHSLQTTDRLIKECCVRQSIAQPRRRCRDRPKRNLDRRNQRRRNDLWRGKYRQSQSIVLE